MTNPFNKVIRNQHFKKTKTQVSRYPNKNNRNLLVNI